MKQKLLMIAVLLAASFMVADTADAGCWRVRQRCGWTPVRNVVSTTRCVVRRVVTAPVRIIQNHRRGVVCGASSCNVAPAATPQAVAPATTGGLQEAPSVSN